MNREGTCVVTGGAGFIGSHLCDKLLELGYSVIAIDNLVTGSEDNLRDAKKSDRFGFVNHDVTKVVSDVPRADFIFHLASPASPADFSKIPQEIAMVNSIGTQNMLEMAKRDGAKFLFASTSEVYGDPKEHPQKETYWGNVNPNGPRACYDESKRFGEMMSKVYERKYHYDIRIIRIFNTYGPRMRKDDGRVISNFINQALSGSPITVYGNGDQTRSFCYVSDLVTGITQAMFGDKTKGEVINLGNPEEYTVRELAAKIKTMTGSSSEIVNSPLPPDDPVRRKPDITKAKEVLHWEPEVSVNEGLKKTIAYYRSS